jgi:small subunit ribosomal protein S9
VIEEPREDQPQEPEAEEPQAEDSPQSPVPSPQDEGQEEQPAAEEEQPPAEEPEPPQREPGKRGKDSEEEVIPGAHLEPDLVLEEERRAAEAGVGDLVEAEVPGVEAPEGEPAETPEEEPEPVAREPLDLAAEARYQATGKRKRAVARVVLRPGDGSFQINGRALADVFPRPKLQRMARQPLETAGYASRLDVMARIHGGGVSSQAGALRHGIARALVEADPSLRVELKRRGFLTRDPRVKERKKAGLKKARKRPQFSKR